MWFQCYFDGGALTVWVHEDQTNNNHRHSTGQFSPVPQTIKGREQQVLCVSAAGTTTAGALGLSDTKETMRATLEIALLLLAGYFTLTDGVSELLHVMILTAIRNTSAKTSTYMWQAHLETASYAESQNFHRKSLKMAVRLPFVTRKQLCVSYRNVVHL